MSLSINRRQFCAGLAAAALTECNMAAQHKAQSRAGERPNIVYVLADDLGWGDLRANNPYSLISMPNAERMAREGMRFTDMHAASAVCTPSRYSLLTGRYCWRSALKKGVLPGSAPNLIEPGRLTVAGLLKQQGYYTAGVGKWHLGLGDKQPADFSKPFHPAPTDHGFDYFYGIPSSLDLPPYFYFENDRAVEAPTVHTDGKKQPPRGVFWREGGMAPSFDHEQCLPTITRKAVDVVRERAKAKQPFFLYIALPAPHTPWLPLEAYRGKSGAGTYGDYVMEVDDMFGKITSALHESGLDENTLLIFTSDNGAEWKPADIDRYGHRANADWRGEKADIWEAGHRVPFLARWPGHIRPNSTSDQTLSLTDLMATVAAITKVNLPANAGEDSFNMLPVLQGTARGPVRTSTIDHSNDGMFCIREGDWKLEEGLGSGGFTEPRTVEPAPGGPTGQLYNLRNDPGELHNLYLQQPAVVARLHTMLEEAKTSGHTRPM